jgi:hypothetical protein
MSKSFLDDAAYTDGAVGIATDGGICVRSFAAAVLDPESKVKLVVETHLDDDIDTGISVVAVCPGQADVSVSLPVGDVAGFAQMLVDSIRTAGAIAEEAASDDLNTVIDAYRRERDALVKLVLQWQNRKDGDPRPDAFNVTTPTT